ncbi:histidine kinase [Saccharophagus degradans]|uniref:CheC, inhibitor of MCP methylation n=1 Tax=Saccharophagus degradans (strain 2-40 / ATCC 43961 / DSM 17024) TaxID=203122 RepID=Q21NS2_SACD2|nr:histidine kinase [Saccharophagus degradans]ABD79657.1 CheC, inhibitor of MCP methylation [Saccharophagus degradans 2-40]
MSVILNLSEDHRDCIQEVTNVAMGQAGDKLARLLDTFVVLSIPHIAVMAPSDVAMALQAIDSNKSVSGVCQGFIGGGIAGEAMLLFNDTSFADLAKLMNYDDELDKQAERELLMDTTNVLFGACLSGIAEQIDMDFSFGPPMVLGQHQAVSEIFDFRNAKWEQALVTEISYELEGYNVQCDLLLIMTDDSIARLLKKIDYLVN